MPRIVDVLPTPLRPSTAVIPVAGHLEGDVFDDLLTRDGCRQVRDREDRCAHAADSPPAPAAAEVGALHHGVLHDPRG
jgi:hypothetical protein